MPFEYDIFGYPSDPEYNKLYDQLCILAGEWRRLKDNPEARAGIKIKYDEISKKLFEHGWNGDIDIECMLPFEHMPVEFWKDYGGAPPSTGEFFKRRKSRGKTGSTSFLPAE